MSIVTCRIARSSNQCASWINLIGSYNSKFFIVRSFVRLNSNRLQTFLFLFLSSLPSLVIHSVDIMTSTASEEPSNQFLSLLFRLFHDIYTSPINLILVFLIIFLLIKLFLLKRKPIHQPSTARIPPPLPKMPKVDLTVEQLRQYNGTDSNGRILTSIYGDIFDVSRRSDLYGPGNRS